MSGNWAAGFLRSWFSDKDGSVSNTRILLVLIVSHVLAWVSALVCLYAWFVIKTHSPVTMTDIVTFVGSAATFATVLGGTLTLIKTGGDAANNRAPNASAQVQPPSVGADGKL